MKSNGSNISTPTNPLGDRPAAFPHERLDVYRVLDAAYVMVTSWNISFAKAAEHERSRTAPRWGAPPGRRRGRRRPARTRRGKRAPPIRRGLLRAGWPADLALEGGAGVVRRGGRRHDAAPAQATGRGRGHRGRASALRPGDVDAVPAHPTVLRAPRRGGSSSDGPPRSLRGLRPPRSHCEEVKSLQ